MVTFKGVKKLTPKKTRAKKKSFEPKGFKEERVIPRASKEAYAAKVKEELERFSKAQAQAKIQHRVSKAFRNFCVVDTLTTLADQRSKGYPLHMLLSDDSSKTLAERYLHRKYANQEFLLANTYYSNGHLYSLHSNRCLTDTEYENGYLAFTYPGFTPEIAQRAIYKYFHESIPTGKVVDHISRARRHNEITNLRLLTDGENQLHSIRNEGKYSYIKGVQYNSVLKRWLYIYEHKVIGQFLEQFNAESFAQEQMKK